MSEVRGEKGDTEMGRKRDKEMQRRGDAERGKSK
jgi:hypothetical protein